MPDKREATKPTCPTCGVDEPAVRMITSVLYGEKGSFKSRPCQDPFHDKPPERAEWEIQLLVLMEVADDEDACDVEIVEVEKRLRAAVQRALDKQQAAALRACAAEVEHTIGKHEQGVKWRELAEQFRRDCAAAEARARES